ncbi:MAG: anthranilate synthase component I family protein [Bacteroidota bacterium]
MMEPAQITATAQAVKLKKQCLYWAAQFPYCAFLDSCGTHMDRYGAYEFILGVARHGTEVIEELGALDRAEGNGKWYLGGLGYDLKNRIEKRLRTRSQATVSFPGMRLFAAEIVIAWRRGAERPEILLGDPPGAIWEAIAQVDIARTAVTNFTGFVSNFSRAHYLDTVQKLRAHIREGDCYEINLTQNFSASGKITHPAALWEKLAELSPVPFAGYARWKGTHLLCASPERFLQLQGDRLLTQPIKGTSSRAKKLSADLAQMRRLRTSLKEQAENVMIVDLSRNDLYRSCEVNSVEVPDLFEVQTFPSVHHLVSTVTGRKSPTVGTAQVIRNTFPPGSMTGAPKVRTCELIDQYEDRARGIYSGSLGYFAPNGDFDLNVVIRSLVYDDAREQISYHVGGAVTWDSDPEAEYEETLLKARPIAELFAQLGKG